MKKLLSIALLVAGFGIGHSIFADTFTVLASDPGLHFALYDSKTNKRIDNIKPTHHQRHEGGNKGFSLNNKSGNRTITIPQDGSIVLVMSRYPDFPKMLRNNDVGLIINESTGQFIKANLNPGRDAVSNVRSFNDMNASEAFVDEALVNPDNNVTAMEWIRRYNAGQPVPKGRAR